MDGGEAVDSGDPDRSAYCAGAGPADTSVSVRMAADLSFRNRRWQHIPHCRTISSHLLTATAGATCVN
jgi:hypothetical protein